MNAKRLLSIFFVAILGGMIAVFAYARFFDRPRVVVTSDQPQFRFTQLPSNLNTSPIDFTYAAEKSVPTVVHVKVLSMHSESSGNPLYDFFFGYRDSKPEPVAGFGSGVIISSDGYIVTNNHVIEAADEISVTLDDKRTFTAKFIGRDPATDLAVIKIDSKNLNYMSYGNSDELKVGEWVLAVGNPYNLTSTVTAGIVSAKARNLNLLNRGMNHGRNNYAIESFIQTDAAVNPGNSGGALVNTRGELVGVNTAIASPTGSYIGNAFAIPVTIVKKVVADLIEYGKVQRALLGVSIKDVDSDVASQKNLDKIEGVLVQGITEGGAAEVSGIKVGDIILSINGAKVNSISELQEQVSRYRPNQKVDIEINRENKKKQIPVILRNMEGTTKLVQKDEAKTFLGAQFAEVSSSESNKLSIRSGVKVIDPGNGKIRDEGILKGFVIISINDRPIRSVEEVGRFLSGHGVVNIEGVYPNGVVASYAFSLK